MMSSVDLKLFQFSTKIEDIVEANMIYTLGKYHEGEKTPATLAWDNVQEGLNCCGVYNASDWGSNIPDSCHEEEEIYHEGCLDTVDTHLFEDVYIVVGQSLSKKDSLN